ncbi:HEAT repeat-containing protein [Actinidia rufa]|uniref:HEAT repeat-containing protein n=1 Tax=Actinidia rufa TaxID=165716 RepID=A0A7J0H725_9ERIC|nr:HEAT repeat-containing protein [Actinidia rufa]
MRRQHFGSGRSDEYSEVAVASSMEMTWRGPMDSFLPRSRGMANSTHLDDLTLIPWIVNKIRVQMNAFLEDGSHEATIAVIFQLTNTPLPSSDVMRRRDRANAFCESIRALDATDLSATSVKDLLLPTIQNLLKDPDALDPVHKEALEIIIKERGGGTFEAISKVMGAHLGLTSSVSSFFGESGLLGKKETCDPPPDEPILQPPVVEDTRFRRIMRVGFTYMLRDFIGLGSESEFSYFASVDISSVFDDLGGGGEEGGGAWLSGRVSAAGDVKCSADVMKMESQNDVIKEFLKESLFDY